MAKDKETNQESLTNKVDLTKVFIVTLKRWPWLVASLAIWIGLAFLYLQFKQPTYMRTAKVLISDESGGSSISGPMDVFSDLGMFSSNKQILDEIIKLESPDLMEKVVQRLDINTLYSKDGDFHKEVVYGDSLPVTVTAPSWTDDNFVKMTIDIAKNGDVTLSDLQLDKDDPDFEQKTPGRLGHPITTPIGIVTVSPTKSYVKGEEYTLYMTKLPLYDAVEMYGKATEVIREDDQANVVIITVYDKSARRATDIISTMIDIYNENSLTNRNAMAVATNKFIDERLRAIEVDLGAVDKEISNFQAENQIPDFEQAAILYLSESQQTDQRLLELTGMLNVSKYLRDYIAKASSSKEVLPSFAGSGGLMGETPLERQIIEYNKIMLERNRLEANSSSNHPTIVAMDVQLDQMRQAILNSADNEIATLNTQIKNVLGEKEKVQSKITNAPLKANEILESGRQQKVLEELYLFLLQKREENQLSQAFGIFNTEVIARPNGDKKPAKPRRWLIFGLAFFMGIVTPFAWTYCDEAFNTKVHNKKDLGYLSAPLVGEIPEWKKGKKRKLDPTTHEEIVVEPDNRNSINDAFRVLRTNITFMTRKPKGDTSTTGTVFMITSMNPGNGKSFVSVNLATALALRDKKVLLIDGDLRHGATSKVVGEPSKGISDYLIGGVEDWRKVVVKDAAMQGAEVLPVGHFPPNPTELLETEKFDKMIDEMREEYDYVFIDCPPVNTMADAKIIEKSVDRSIFVIRAGMLERADLAEVEKFYKDKELKNMSIILNGLKTVDSSYHSYHSV